MVCLSPRHHLLAVQPSGGQRLRALIDSLVGPVLVGQLPAELVERGRQPRLDELRAGEVGVGVRDVVMSGGRGRVHPDLRSDEVAVETGERHRRGHRARRLRGEPDQPDRERVAVLHVGQVIG